MYKSAQILVATLAVLLYSAVACSDEAHVSVSISQSGDTFLVEATVDAPVRPQTAWEVLTDYDHMPGFVSSLTSSKVVSREGNTLVVKQEGSAKYGLLSFSYQSEREIHLDPMKHIHSKNLSGTAKRMESDTQLGAAGNGHGVQIRYHAEIVPDSALARMFGASALQHQVEEQFRSMVSEMQKREASRSSVAAL